MTKLTRGEIEVVADRLNLHDCLHEVVSEDAPELGADYDDVVNACDTTLAELAELELEEMVKYLTPLQRWCLIDAVEGATVLPRAKWRDDDGEYLDRDLVRKTRRACNGAAKKLSKALGVELAFPDR